jgi:hypothetical protein
MIKVATESVIKASHDKEKQKEGQLYRRTQKQMIDEWSCRQKERLTNTLKEKFTVGYTDRKTN